jgi:hypothetical protein
MQQREQRRELTNRVEIDDAYLGGERKGKPGRGSENKVPFIAAVQISDQCHPLYVRMDRVKTFSHSAVEQWAQCALSASTHVWSDGLKGSTILGEMVGQHTSIITGSGSQAAQHRLPA